MGRLNEGTTKGASCSEEEVAVKSFFLGPQAENRDWVRDQINRMLSTWFAWRERHRPDDGRVISIQDTQNEHFEKQQHKTAELLAGLSARFQKEIPKFSPRYVGHMFSEISLPALLGHVLTLLHNPNNISGESSRVGIELENEALQKLATMVGFRESHGHFTSGGTLANFEMLYRARARITERCGSEKQPLLLVPAHGHYSWKKGAAVFGISNLKYVPLDSRGHLSAEALESLLDDAERAQVPVLGVVSVLGTTEMGVIDPVDQINTLLKRRTTLGGEIWHHVDGAYGAFFRTLLGPDVTIADAISAHAARALEALSEVTSVTLDPHKLGYVPYACGVFLCREAVDYRKVSFGAPYVNFDETYDKGLFTLEGSRSAAGPVATWMAAHAVGFDQNGYGRILSRTIRLKTELQERLSAIEMVRMAPHTDTNLLCFTLAAKGEKSSVTNARVLELYRQLNVPEAPFTVSKTRLAVGGTYDQYMKSWTPGWQATIDSEDLVLIRLCLMNPFLGSRELKSDLFTEFVTLIADHCNVG